MVQEVAALTIAERDRAAWRTHRTRLRFDVRDRLDAIVGPEGDGAAAESRSVFGRARLLRSVPAFAQLPSEALVSLALASEERLLKEGQRLPNPREPQDSFYVLLDGNLTGQDAAGEGFGLLTLFGVLPGARTVEARGPCRLVRLEPTRLFELAGENLALIPGLLDACRLLSRDTTSA
jgi:hypothetical protein